MILVDLEMSLSDEQAKRRAMRALSQAGYAATSGPVRMAYPFTMVVGDVAGPDVEVVSRLVRALDPGAGVIVESLAEASTGGSTGRTGPGAGTIAG